MEELTIFDMIYPKYKITKPIRLIEMFSGYGSQALALKYLGVPFEHWKICEWAIKSIQAYKDIHFTDDDTDYSQGMNESELMEYLYHKGISNDYNKPMTLQQIGRIYKKGMRKVYNNIQATHNLVNIQQVKGKDLEIVDTDKYDYILTYSFPCQDLSLAGKGKGMSDTSTRSGMLWEVERILTECYELGTMPQILLMENVPQVHGVDNLQDFNKWQLRLEELGYKNYWQDLIATDYGIPQTRNRCFMVSILGDYNYTFPKPIPLKLKLKDLLEDNVNMKYYLSEKMLEYMMSESSGGLSRKEMFERNFKEDKEVAATITTQGYLEATEGDGVDLTQPNSETRRGTVQKDKAQTLTTMGGENNSVVVVGNYSKSNHNASRIVDQEHSAPTVMENHGTITAIVDKPKVLGCIGEKDSNNNTQWKQQNRVYDDKVAISVTTSFNPYYGIATNESKEWQKDPLEEKSRTILANKSNGGVGCIDNNLRIRKVTPKECFRLMGVKDEDYYKIAKNQSDSSLYHLAGDSIVVNVLMAIFKEMI